MNNNGTIPHKNKKYSIEVDTDNLTWSDATLQARYKVIQHTLNKIEDEDSDEYIVALKEMVEIFDDMAEVLDRVANITCDGESVSVRNIPQSVLTAVINEISSSNSEDRDLKNLNSVQ